MEDDRFAICGLSMTSICSEAVKKKLRQLTERLEEIAAEYGMEISSDKSKIIVSSMKPRRSTNIQMNGQTHEEVDQYQFKYLGSTQTKDET